MADPIHLRQNSLPPAALASAVDSKLDLTQRLPWLWLLLLIAMLTMQVKTWWVPGRDAACYLSMARHFAHGRVARFDSPHLRFAPGYSLLISPAYMLGDRPFLAISIIHLALAIALTFLLYAYFKRLAPEAATLLTGFVMLNATTWMHYQQTLSEIAFMLTLMASTWCIALMTTSKSKLQLLRRGILAVMVLIFASYTRQVGILLIAGLGVSLAVQALERRISWRKAATMTLGLGVPVVLAVLALILWDREMAAMTHTSRSNLDYLREPGISFAQQVLEGVRMRISEIGRLVLPGMVKAYARRGEWLNVNTGIYTVLFCALTVGWWRAVRATRDPLMLTLPFYLLFYVLWPFDQGTRFMLPMLPVLTLSLWWLMREMPRRQTVLAVLVAVHLAVSVGYWVRTWPQQRYDARWNEMASLSRSLDGQSAAAWKVDQALVLMAMLESDRAIEILEPPLGIAESKTDWNWLMLPADFAPPAGYDEVEREADIVLLRRKKP